MKSFMGITKTFGEIVQIDTYMGNPFDGWSEGMTTLIPPVIPTPDPSEYDQKEWIYLDKLSRYSAIKVCDGSFVSWVDVYSGGE